MRARLEVRCSGRPAGKCATCSFSKCEFQPARRHTKNPIDASVIRLNSPLRDYIGLAALGVCFRRQQTNLFLNQRSAFGVDDSSSNHPTAIQGEVDALNSFAFCDYQRLDSWLALP